MFVDKSFTWNNVLVDVVVHKNEIAMLRKRKHL